MSALKIVAGVLAVGALAATSACGGTDSTDSGGPSPTGTATSKDIRQVDWKNVTLDLPKILLCPAGTVTFRDGVDNSQSGATNAPATGPSWEISDKLESGTPTPIYGDFDNDGKDDALLLINCTAGAPQGSGLVGVELDSAGKPSVMGLVTETEGQAENDFIDNASISNGVVKVVVKRVGTTPITSTTTNYRWDGTRFAKVS